MRKNLILGILAGMSLAGCAEHEIPVDYSLKAGNIYCADGSIVPLTAYDDTMRGIGVIVVVGGEDDNYRAVAVGRTDIGEYAYSDTLYTFNDVSTETDICNGRENTALLWNEHLDVGAVGVPAAQAAIGFNDSGVTGWHLPSVAELRAVAGLEHTVRKSLERIGGEWPEEEWYTSSTQDGSNESTKLLYSYSVSLSEGRLKDSQKTEAHAVRPFIVIE